MKSIFIASFLFLTTAAVAQKPYLIKTNEYKLSPQEVEKLSPILSDYKVFIIENENILADIDKVSQEFSFYFPHVENLPSNSIDFIDSRLVTEKTISSGGGSKINHYKATGLSGIESFGLSVLDSTIYGLYHPLSGDDIYIRPLGSLLGYGYSRKVLIVYTSSSIKKDADQTCEVIKTETSIKQSLKNLRRTTSDNDYCRIIRVAAEADNEFYAVFGSTSMDELESMFDLVASTYSTQLNITIELVYKYVWTTTDPYSVTSTKAAVLSEFKSYWDTNKTGVSRDLAFLLSFRNLSVNGGYAYGNSVCGVDAYGMFALPSHFVCAIAHEIGHIIGHVSPDHDSTIPETIMHANLSSNLVFTTASKELIWDMLNTYGDNSCVVNGEINMFLNSSKIDAYDTNNSCTYAYEYLYAPGANSISWSITNFGASASIASSSAQNAQIYSGSSSGSYEVHATKVNDCGTTNRYYPFYVDNCFSFMAYPNATSDFLYVEFGKDAKADGYPDEISLIDEKSNVLIIKFPKEMLKNKEIDSNKPLVALDLSSLQEGTYYLRLLFKDRPENKYETKRILKLPK